MDRLLLAASEARLSSDGNVDLTALATFLVAGLTGVLAIATFVLAYFAQRSLEENKYLIKATQEFAKAMQESATAAQLAAEAAAWTVAEIQQDRVLAYRPHLTWRIDALGSRWTVPGCSVRSHIQGDIGRVTLVNHGKGLAVNSLCCFVWLPAAGRAVELASNDPALVMPADSVKSDLKRRPSSSLHDTSVVDGASEGPHQTVAFCQDQLGNSFRFTAARTPDTWRVGQANPPPWVEFYLNYLSNKD